MNLKAELINNDESNDCVNVVADSDKPKENYRHLCSSPQLDGGFFSLFLLVSFGFPACKLCSYQPDLSSGSSKAVINPLYSTCLGPSS